MITMSGGEGSGRYFLSILDVARDEKRRAWAGAGTWGLLGAGGWGCASPTNGGVW